MRLAVATRMGLTPQPDSVSVSSSRRRGHSTCVRRWHRVQRDCLVCLNGSNLAEQMSYAGEIAGTLSAAASSSSRCSRFLLACGCLRAGPEHHRGGDAAPGIRLAHVPPKAIGSAGRGHLRRSHGYRRLAGRRHRASLRRRTTSTSSPSTSWPEEHRHLVLGGVAEHVLERAVIPVLWTNSKA